MTCERCGADVDDTYTLSLEWPTESSDDPGSGVFRLCADCADAVATNVIVDRALALDLDDCYAGVGSATDGAEVAAAASGVSDD